MFYLLLILHLIVSTTSRMLYKRDDSSILLLIWISEWEFSIFHHWIWVFERYFIRISRFPFLISSLRVKMVLTFMKDVFYISCEDYIIFHLYSATVVNYRLNLNIRPFLHSKNCHTSLCGFIHSINCHIKLLFFKSIHLCLLETFFSSFHSLNVKYFIKILFNS